MIHICKTCGKTYTPNSNRQKYCCDECNPWKQKKSYEKKCPVCKKVFTTGSVHRKYCSDECYKVSVKLKWLSREV